MTIDGYVHQLPDTDPLETEEWLDSLDSVIDSRGKVRARFLVSKLTERARERQVGTPAEVSTPYVNTIPTDEQGWFPGDVDVERRIRAYIRWNAAVMVVNANTRADGIGGHLSTFASSAALYEVGFNHFFRGKADGVPGDQVYIQGHAVPGVYARAFLEGRLDESHLDNFRREIGGGGLSSYPHPWLMPDFWEFPTVSMGLGPLNSIYQARFNKYLQHRHLDDTSRSRVWCFLGDGETDEPESLGSISLAAREGLDNLTWVINCNLQRLDGPVRGNGKIIQELEAIFRGAGWNVIKVIWGSGWDDLLARDVDGVLLHKMNTTVDGEFQRYAVESGAYIRDHFFGPDPRLRKLVDHLTDDDLRNLPRGGHDYEKMYAAYKAATEQVGAPTVILAKTVKGWTLGSDVEARNATHQIKKMTRDQLKVLSDRAAARRRHPRGGARRRRSALLPAADRLDRVPLPDGPPPGARRAAPDPHHGDPPRRSRCPPDAPFTEFDAGSAGQSVSTTMAFTRLLRNLARTEGFGPAHGADHPRRGPHLRDGRPVPRVRHLRRARPAVRVGRRPAAALLHREPGRPAARGGHHRGRVDVELHGRRHVLRHPRRADGAVLHLLLDVRLPAGGRPHLGRVGRPGQGLPARGHGRSHHADGRGPAAPGRAQPRARVHGAHLPGLRPRLRLRDGGHRPPRHAPHVRRHRRRRRTGAGDPVFFYLTLYNENYPMPVRPEHVTEDDIVGGLYRWAEAPDGLEAKVTIVFSGSAHLAAQAAHATPWPASTASAPSSGRPRPTSASARTRCRPSAGTGSTPPSRPGRSRSPSCWPGRAGRSSRSPTS